MGVELSDSAQIIWELATVTGTSLYAAVGLRVWSPVPVNFDNSQKGVVFHSERNSSDFGSPVLDGNWIVKSYGGSTDPADARSTARLWFERFDRVANVLTASGRIVHSRCLTFEMGTFVDPETGWMTHLGKYHIRTR